jgi:putative Holliday junction resolvase
VTRETVAPGEVARRGVAQGGVTQGRVAQGAILGIDLGERRIGLALAEAGGLAARPLATVNRTRDLDPRADAAVLYQVVVANRVTELVVGLPLEASGAEGAMAGAARAWATAVAEQLGLPVTLRDERLSSHLAETRLGPMPRGRSGGPPSRSQRDRYRARVDREAAAIILQDELHARRDGGAA